LWQGFAFNKKVIFKGELDAYRKEGECV